MSGGGRGGGEEEDVVHMEDAVKMLVDHLVKPVLPRGAIFGAAQGERYMEPDKQRAVAQQIHTAIILYNYYHRKMSPQLAFADAKRFFVCASLSAGEDLLAYLSMVHERENNPGKHVRLSVTDRAAIQACELAEELDASKDSPDMAMWPISKVAVLLLDPTRKKCLIEYSANTKGIWSIIEKELDATAGNSHSTNQPAGQESTGKGNLGALNTPYMLRQQAYSEVECRTGMKGSNLRLLDETLAYSLSKERTTTKLFIVEYEQTMKGNLVEMCLEELISSMTGPLFANDPFPKTTSVVEYYHILPYKEILFELLHRKWPSDSPLNKQSHRHGKGSLHSAIDENVEEQDVNSTSKMQKRITRVSTPKQGKQAIGANSNQDYRTSKHKRNSKRKSEASRTDVCAEGPDGEIHIIENGPPPVIIDVEISKPLTKSRNTKAAAAASRETKILQAVVQVEKNKTQEQSRRDNVPQDVFPAEAPHVDLMKNRSLEHQNMDVSVKSGGTTEYTNDQMYDSLRSIQKIRDDILRKECILQERSAQCDMDIQTILSGILPFSHFKNAYIYNHAVELLHFCGQHCGHVFLGAIRFQKLCDKLWCTILFIVDKLSAALCDVQIVRQKCGKLFLYQVRISCTRHVLKLNAEGKMTPKTVSIIHKYKETCSDMMDVTNSSCSGDGGQSITQRKGLREALLRHNSCEELDEICRGGNWIFPRYTVVPSVSDGMFHASVRLTCPEFEMSITGGPRPTPHEARCSAAANMIQELHKKAEEQEQ